MKTPATDLRSATPAPEKQPPSSGPPGLRRVLLWCSLTISALLAIWPFLRPVLQHFVLSLIEHGSFKLLEKIVMQVLHALLSRPSLVIVMMAIPLLAVVLKADLWVLQKRRARARVVAIALALLAVAILVCSYEPKDGPVPYLTSGLALGPCVVAVFIFWRLWWTRPAPSAAAQPDEAPAPKNVEAASPPIPTLRGGGVFEYARALEASQTGEMCAADPPKVVYVGVFPLRGGGASAHLLPQAPDAALSIQGEQLKSICDPKVHAALKKRVQNNFRKPRSPLGNIKQIEQQVAEFIKLARWANAPPERTRRHQLLHHLTLPKECFDGIMRRDDLHYFMSQGGEKSLAFSVLSPAAFAAGLYLNRRLDVGMRLDYKNLRTGEDVIDYIATNRPGFFIAALPPWLLHDSAIADEYRPVKKVCLTGHGIFGRSRAKAGLGRIIALARNSTDLRLRRIKAQQDPMSRQLERYEPHLVDSLEELAKAAGGLDRSDLIMLHEPVAEQLRRKHALKLLKDSIDYTPLYLACHEQWIQSDGQPTPALFSFASIFTSAWNLCRIYPHLALELLSAEPEFIMFFAYAACVRPVPTAA